MNISHLGDSLLDVTIVAWLIGLFSIDSKYSHVIFVITVHVDRVIDFSIFIVYQMSSLEQYVVNLFLDSFRRSVHRTEYYEVLYRQSLFDPVSSFAPLFQ